MNLLAPLQVDAFTTSKWGALHLFWEEAHKATILPSVEIDASTPMTTHPLTRHHADYNNCRQNTPIPIIKSRSHIKLTQLDMLLVMEWNLCSTTIHWQNISTTKLTAKSESTWQMDMLAYLTRLSFILTILWYQQHTPRTWRFKDRMTMRNTLIFGQLMIQSTRDGITSLGSKMKDLLTDTIASSERRLDHVSSMSLNFGVWAQLTATKKVTHARLSSSWMVKFRLTPSWTQLSTIVQKHQI